MNLTARRSLRLRLRDLAAGAAFTAVGLSGSIPTWVTGLFVVAWVLSLFGRRPLANARGWAVVVLLLVAVVLFGLVFRGALDLVVAAVSFAALVTGHRLVSEPTSVTDQQVLLASLLLIAGAAALSGEVWFAVCLLAFGVFSCLHLGLSVVEGPVERDEELPLAPVFTQVSLGVAVALVFGVAFFVAFPRLSWNVAARRAGPGLLGGSTGMSDRVRLGGGGDIKTSARTVLRARLEPDPGVDQLDDYWIGRRFDRFDGREWRGSGEEQRPSPQVRLASFTGGSLVQRIELLPAYGSRTLVAISHPALFSSPMALLPTGSVPSFLVNSLGEEVRFATEAASYTYVATSMRGTWRRDEEVERERALVLPELDPRVAELAKQIVGDQKDPRRMAQLLERHLQTRYGYTLELEGDVADPLAEFLFNRKAGHCEHFATALAIMLRTLGVPARVAVGFFGGERALDVYVVRAGDAHAWVEAWVDDGEGWVTYDATPGDGRRSRPPTWLARAADVYERIELLWRNRVLDYSLFDQVHFMRRLVNPPRDVAEHEPRPTTFSGLSRRRLLEVGLGLTVLGAAWVLIRRPGRARTHPATSFLERIERRLDDAHISRHADETLEALCARLTHEAHPAAEAVVRAARRYLDARFGGATLSAAEMRGLLDAIGRG